MAQVLAKANNTISEKFSASIYLFKVNNRKNPNNVRNLFKQHPTEHVVEFESGTLRFVLTSYNPLRHFSYFSQ